nr:LemA family protein [Desulfoluna limicola]
MVVGRYNAIQAKDEAVIASWADVEATYQRRADLIPNLVQAVKGSALHENETLKAVTEARARVGQLEGEGGIVHNLSKLEEYQAVQNGLGSALSRLLLVVESYPDLKANSSFRDLLHQIEGTENRINVARKRYNDATMGFNTQIRTFPGNLVNNVFLKLPRREPFQTTQGSANAPVVTFSG